MNSAGQLLGGLWKDQPRQLCHDTVPHVARIYPTPAQEVVLDRQGHTARALWNLLHEWRTCGNGGIARRPSVAEVDRQLRAARTDPLPGWEWLAELPAQATQQVLKNYLRTWNRFYEGSARPPKSKKGNGRLAGGSSRIRSDGACASVSRRKSSSSPRIPPGRSASTVAWPIRWPYRTGGIWTCRRCYVPENSDGCVSWNFRPLVDVPSACPVCLSRTGSAEPTTRLPRCETARSVGATIGCISRPPTLPGSMA
jgi:hypothetical protein